MKVVHGHSPNDLLGIDLVIRSLSSVPSVVLLLRSSPLTEVVPKETLFRAHNNVGTCSSRVLLAHEVQSG